MQRICLSLCVCWVLLTAACGPGEEPVGSLAVGADALSLPYPSRATLDVTFEPSAELEALEGEPFVFVHLLDEQGQVLRTFDHPLPFEWQPGDSRTYAVELWQSALGAPLDPGTYTLTLGLYDAAGHRWALDVDAQEVDDQEYRVAEVEVPPLADDPVQVTFPGAWSSLERGGDRQVLVRRWVEDGGRIELSGFGDSLDVALLLRIPPEGELQQSRLVLQEGATEPAVDVTSDCADSATRVAGFGSHAVELTLSLPEDAESCSISLEPGFVYLNLDGFEKRSVSLENLTWNR